MLKRETDSLQNEVHGWARVSHHPSLRPAYGAGDGSHGAAAVLACVWPVVALIVEFITIPPVHNHPAASALGETTPSAAALAVLTAAAEDDPKILSRWSDEFRISPSPVQGLLHWLDTGMTLPSSAVLPPLQPSTKASTTFPSMGSPLPPTVASAAGWRAWELLDAALDLVGPTGDTLLWDAGYRHGLSVDMGIIGSAGEGTHASGVVDPVAAKVLNWGRRGWDSSDRWDDGRTPTDREALGTSIKPIGGFLSGGRKSGGGNSHSSFFVNAKGKGNPLADAGDVPWMLVRLLLGVFVSGGGAEGPAQVRTWPKTSRRRPSSSCSSGTSSSNASSGVSGMGKGGGGAGTSPPSIALVALQRLIALINSLESSGYEPFEFEVLHIAARVSTALRTTLLTPRSAWVLGALQLLVRRFVRFETYVDGARRCTVACLQHDGKYSRAIML